MQHVRGRKVHTGFWRGNLTKGNHLKDQSTEGIIKMDLKSWNAENRIDLARHTDKRSVATVMNLRVPLTRGEFLD